ncbi:hypothetical protein M438DRAFT_365439 [Aureobasidium pullulans EXF-150]|uniref:Uncharacterized protein n=1 Tax=Aureobasidium pullulans EXF-150 TaxID=1043002 RepID=A0A074XGI8_AURPU|nr:uncharacterized protein M438DRAFT_365439 [Aureobasidium pullulans EXF-150]KEQ84553.1 hypothetical protein M438DRAFT_365439 [Aureobasidium pullulans EXF-150]
MAPKENNPAPLKSIVAQKRPSSDTDMPRTKRVHFEDSSQQALVVVQQIKTMENVIESIKYQQEQVEGAIESWIFGRGGEDALGGTNAAFLRVVRMAMNSTKIAMELAENQELTNKTLKSKVEELLENDIKEE